MARRSFRRIDLVEPVGEAGALSPQPHEGSRTAAGQDRRMSGWHDPKAAAIWDAEADESPARGEQVELLVDVLDAFSPRCLLELGVGSGLIAERLLDALPNARVVGVDRSAAMLDLARSRLQPFDDRVALVQGDLHAPESIPIEDGTVDAAYSVQTLHRLEDAPKAEVFAWLGGSCRRMRRWRYDTIVVPSPLFDAYAVAWRRAGVEMPPSAGAYETSLREKGDIPARLEQNLM